MLATLTGWQNKAPEHRHAQQTLRTGLTGPYRSAPRGTRWHRLEHRPTHEDGNGTGQDSPSALFCYSSRRIPELRRRAQLELAECEEMRRGVGTARDTVEEMRTDLVG